jgi:subtilase family serine protease
MTKIMMSQLTSLLALGSLTAIAAGPAHATMSSKGEIAPWVARAEKAGPVENSKAVRITVYLAFKNEKALDTLLAAQNTPGSAEYGRYLTPAQFHARFAPDKTDVEAVRTSLRKQGLTIGHIPKSGFYIEATGTVAQVKAAFHVDQNYYRFQGNVMRANSLAPTIPARFASVITHIGGLTESGALVHPMHVGIDRASNPRPAVTARPASPIIQPPTADFLDSPYCSSYWGDHTATITPQPVPFAASMPYLNCGYTPQQMNLAYGGNKSATTGKGVTVAIVDAYASPTIRSDANTYFKNHGLPLLNGKNFTQVVPDGIYHVSPAEVCGPQGWFTEESLDVESVHTFAPGANIVYVGARNCDDPLFDAVYDTIDSASPPNIITNSWGENGEFSSPDEQAVNNAEFKQAAAEGISILFSSGDDGDLTQENGVASGSWPANSPWVTAVGGTTLALKDSSGTKQEWGWGTYRAFLGGTVTFNATGSVVKATAPLGDFSFYSGAGGGVSFVQPQPQYQRGVVPASISTVTFGNTGEPIPFSGPRRVIPDVAMNADPYSGFLMGETFTIASTAVNNGPCTATSTTEEYCEFGEGGTSLASPSFAGVLARVDEVRLAKGLNTIGFANPHLYGLKVGAPGATTALVDVRAPSTATSVLRAYPAVVGENPRVVTVNSDPVSTCPKGICEGVDDVFNQTTPAYDNVTGLGTPWIPSLVATLGGK